MSPIRSLAALGASAAVLGSAGAVATAAAPGEPAAADRTVLRPALAGEDSVADVMRRAGRASAHRAYLRELARHGARPTAAVAEMTRRELRARTRALRAERRAEARAAARAEAAAAAQPTGVLARIAQCESGGDPTAIGGGGLYRGMYQFDQATWESVGGVGDPAAASVAEQTKRAQILLDRAGTAPWPVCGA